MKLKGGNWTIMEVCYLLYGIVIMEVCYIILSIYAHIYTLIGWNFISSYGFSLYWLLSRDSLISTLQILLVMRNVFQLWIILSANSESSFSKVVSLLVNSLVPHLLQNFKPDKKINAASKGVNRCFISTLCA